MLDSDTLAAPAVTIINRAMASQYWPNDARRNLALNTRKSYLPVWYRHLKPRMGHLQLRQITPPVDDLRPTANR